MNPTCIPSDVPWQAMYPQHDCFTDHKDRDLDGVKPQYGPDRSEIAENCVVQGCAASFEMAKAPML